MGTSRHRPLWIVTLLTLWLVLPAPRLAAQARFDTLARGDTIFINNCRHSNGELVIAPDDLQQIFTGSSSGTYDAWAVLDLSTVTNMFIYSFSFSGNPNNCIEMYRIGSGDTVIYAHSTTSDYDTAFGGAYIFHIHMEYSHLQPAGLVFSFRWAGTSTAPTCRKSLRSVTVTNIGGTTAVLNWVSNSDSIYVDYGCGSRLVTGVDSYLIIGLDTMTDYHVRVNTWCDVGHECCFIDRDFSTNTAVQPVCIDATDLDSPFATCLTGSAEFPNENVRRVTGRHTIINIDSIPYDNIIGPALPTAPQGHTSSLRLGNSSTGAEGESVIYQILVDTMQYNILMLKYAAVLQVPDHQPAAQPRFGFTILDDNMHPIDPSCGAANFVASEDLDWNFTNSVAWKPWTTIGIDLSPYHGRLINIRFTTRDCIGGAHFGYAYIVTECFRKGITTPHCGHNATSSLIAPPGFNYYWYTDLSPDTVSTSPEVNIIESDVFYHCRMSYIENPECWFEMRVWAGRRFPLADFDYEIFTTDCIEFNVVFTNLSTISNDGINPIGSGEPCEQSYWDFGNGSTSSAYSPTVHYDTAGTFDVTLISTIGEGMCQDTLTVPITMPTFLRYQEYHRACDSLTWQRDSTTYYHDTVGPLAFRPGPMRCDTAYEMHLIIDHSKFTQLDRDTACWRTPYSWNGHTFTDTISSVTVYHLGDTLLTTARCDSIVGIEVVRYPQIPVSIAATADCHIKQYRLVGAADAPYVRWGSSPPDPALDDHFYDSVITLTPQQITHYWLTADFSAAGVCPSGDTVTLAPVAFPSALLRLSPEYLTIDNMEYDAYDIGPDGQTRAWLVHEYLDGAVVATSTPPPYAHIHGQTSTIIDSVRVTMTADNGFCTDTTSASIPLMRAAIWAPNVFTPLSENNNRFQLFTYGLHATELNIYNREGLLMFHATDLDHSWDGTHNGHLCQQGAYTWRLDYIADDFPDKPQKKVGTILLLH